jgi:hypothetical protein
VQVPVILDTYASHTQRLGVLASPSDAVAYIHTVVLRALGWHLSWYLEAILGQSGATLTIGVSLAAVFSWVVATQGRQVRVFTLTAVLTGSGYTVLAAEITTYAVREAPFLSPIGFEPASRYSVMPIILLVSAAIVAVDTHIRRQDIDRLAAASDLPWPRVIPANAILMCL